MPRLAKPKQKPPHASVFEAPAPLNVELRRMFSGFAFQLGGRIEGMLRDHRKSPQNNGVWLILSESSSPAAPDPGREFPSICPIYLLGNKFRQLRLAICGRVIPHASPWSIRLRSIRLRSVRLSISPSGSRRKGTVAVHRLVTARGDRFLR